MPNFFPGSVVDGEMGATLRVRSWVPPASAFSGTFVKQVLSRSHTGLCCPHLEYGGPGMGTASVPGRAAARSD